MSVADAIVVGIMISIIPFSMLVSYFIDRGFPWSDVAVARRARKDKWRSYYIEYLGYGYSEHDAANKANERMEAEAKAAETVLDKEDK